MFSPQDIKTIFFAILAAVGAFIWTNVTEAPKKTAETFSIIQQQTAETRTTVLEMKTTIDGLSRKLDENERDTSAQQAKISGLEASVNSLSDRVEKIERTN